MVTATINLDDDGYQTLRVKWGDKDYVELLTGNANIGYRRAHPGLGPYPSKVWHWSRRYNLRCYDYPMVFIMEDWKFENYPQTFSIEFPIS